MTDALIGIREVIWTNDKFSGMQMKVAGHLQNLFGGTSFEILMGKDSRKATIEDKMMTIQPTVEKGETYETIIKEQAVFLLM